MLFRKLLGLDRIPTTPVNKNKKYVAKKARPVLIASSSRILRPRTHLAPPGYCTKEQHRALKKRVGEACKKDPRSCDDKYNLSCDDIQERIRRNEACIAARETISQICFNSPDTIHDKEINKAEEALAECQERYRNACNPTPPAPANIPVPAVNTVSNLILAVAGILIYIFTRGRVSLAPR